MPNNVDLVGYKQTVRALDKISKKMLPTVIDAVTRIASDIRTEAIRGIQRTPRQNRVYKSPKRKVMQRPGKIGHPPASDSGNLIKSIVFETRSTEIEVGSIQRKPPYPMILEEGTKFYKPWHPWLQPAADKIGDGAEDRIIKAITSFI